MNNLRIESADFIGFAEYLFEQFRQPSYLSLGSNVSLLAFRSTPKDATKVTAATLASFVDPDEFGNRCIGARHNRQENPGKQFHGLRPLQLTGYQLPGVDVQFQAFRLVQ